MVIGIHDSAHCRYHRLMHPGITDSLTECSIIASPEDHQRHRNQTLAVRPGRHLDGIPKGIPHGMLDGSVRRSQTPVIGITAIRRNVGDWIDIRHGLGRAPICPHVDPPAVGCRLQGVVIRRIPRIDTG